MALPCRNEVKLFRDSGTFSGRLPGGTLDIIVGSRATCVPVAIHSQHSKSGVILGGSRPFAGGIDQLFISGGVPSRREQGTYVIASNRKHVL